MRPNELRLGNLVRIKNSGEIVSVEHISRRKVGLFHNNDKSREYFCKYSEIEPVPFLDMFPNSKDADMFQVETYQQIGRKEYISTTMFNKGFVDGAVMCSDGLYFKYVHEIQNYHFARYGEELIF